MTSVDKYGNIAPTANDMFSLPCVVMSEFFTDKGIGKQHCVRNASMNELVLALAAARPTWVFTIVASGFSARWGVRVMDKGETLGDITWTWFRGDNAFSITNRRIEKQRERTSAYRTKDVKKALATIKKLFATNSVSERVAIAKERANDVLRSEFNNKRNTANATERDMKTHAQQFLNTVNDQFYAWLRDTGKQSVIDSYEHAKAEMLTVETAYEAFIDSQAALVIRAEGQYIVKLRDKVEILDDTRLPDWLKAKVGMLKLVGDESFISGVGCRASAECFVVLADNEGEQL